MIVMIVMMMMMKVIMIMAVNIMIIVMIMMMVMMFPAVRGCLCDSCWVGRGEVPGSEVRPADGGNHQGGHQPGVQRQVPEVQTK